MADFYTQCPNMLIFGLPDLSSNDRIVLLGLMYLAWGSEGPHQISIRDLAKFVHISPSVLCDSAKGEQEKHKQIEQGKFREGSLTRLSNYGYITIEEIESKTYITIHLEKIWQDNVAFRKSIKSVPNSNTLKKAVLNSNTSVLNSNNGPPDSVRNANATVRHSNNDVPQGSFTGGFSDPLKNKKEMNIRKDKESDSLSLSHIHSFTLSSDCLDKIRDFAEMYGDRSVEQCQLEAEQIYQETGKSEDNFYNALFDANSTIVFKKKRNMGAFFRQLRSILAEGES